MRSILLFCLLAVCTFSIAQQTQYEQQWVEVDTLELRGQVTSALSIVNDIRSNSKGTNSIAYIKASMFRWKFLKTTTENAEVTIFNEINQAINESPSLDQSLLYTVKAKLLFDYFSANRYKNNRRSQVEIITDDITTWDNITLVKEIVNSYQKALNNKALLLKTPAGDITPLLDASIVSRHYKPTVYDVIAQQAMDFYNSSLYGIERPETLFEVNNEAIFKDSEAFRAWDFDSKDNLVSKFNAIKLLQDIEAAHKDDKDQTAFVFAQLKRLQFAKFNHRGDTNERMYEEALITLSRKHKSIPIYGLLQFELANLYASWAPTYYSKNQTAEVLAYYQKAENFCHKIIEAYPNSEGAIKAKRLLNKIQKIELTIQTKPHTLPGKVNRMLVNYRNVDSLQMKIFKLPTENKIIKDFSSYKGFSRKENQKYKKDILELQKRIIAEQLYILPDGIDRNPHTAEFLLPALDHGYYLVCLTNSHIEKAEGFAYAVIEVSDFGIKKTEYSDKLIYHFYNRASGQPEQDLSIQVKGAIEELTISGVTDKLGEFEVKKPLKDIGSSSNRQIVITAIKESDTLVYSDHINRSYDYDNDEDDEYEAKTEIFIDRDIYRPGQTMYFKGILIKEVNEKSFVVPNETVTLIIEDTNYEEVFEKEYRTNEYGSFSGEFTLPEDVLAGNFRIYADEGSEDTEFWDDLDDYFERPKYFKVEAYKRPTFEITFDQITGVYKPNDSITVTGNVKAFLGSNVTDALGNYTIKRSQYSRYSYYGYRSNNGRQLDGGEIITDTKGNFSITFKADYEGVSTDNIFQFSIDIKITDLNGETQEESTVVKVGKNNLLTSIVFPDKVRSDQSVNVEVINENLNGVFINCNNTIKLYKLTSLPKKIFNRLWGIPEYQEISPKDFATHFPNEPYEENVTAFVKEELIYEFTTKDQSKYTTTIKIDPSWQSGDYVIKHTAQDKNGIIVTTSKNFKLTNPETTYLPSDQLFDYEVLNENPRKDGYVTVQLRTSLKKLPVYVNGFYGSNRFFAKKLDVNGNQTIKIPLKSSYKNSATIRLKYAQYDRFFVKDIKVDLSAPSEYLQVETTSYRSKLYPDSKEKWSFKITDKRGKKAQAEVLASMYDMSLDKFAQSYWNPKMAFNNYEYSSIPTINSSGYYPQSFNIRIYDFRPEGYVSIFDKINYYGLSLTNGDYYKKYLRKLKTQRRLLNPNSKFAGNIKGVVLDDDIPLPGANINIKNTDIIVQTDFDGNFSIDANFGDVLIFTYVGYKTQEVVVNGGSSIYINLEVDDAVLEEVVVVGYAVAEKEEKYRDNVVKTANYDDFNYYRGNTYTKNTSLTGAVGLADYDEISEENALSDRGIRLQSPQGSDGLGQEIHKDSFKNIKVRTKLNETAFFYPHLMTNKKGEIKFTFDAPQLLTKWKFRLLAHSKDVLVGGIEKEVITQKDVSLVPNTSRFLREGDTVSLSAKVANLTGKPLEGAAQLQLLDAVTMQPIDKELSNANATQNFEIDAYGNTSVFWEIKIPVGVQAVTYRMLAKAGKFSDGEENILPVLSNRMMITETVPFLVRAGQDKTVQVNHLLETRSTTLENHKFTLEYTSNPSWYALQSLPYLMEFPFECAEQTFSRLYANSLSAKILNSNPKIKNIFDQWKGDGVLKSALEENEFLKNILISETPWLRDAQSETERKKRLGLLFDLEKNAISQQRAIDKLVDMQNDDGGFPWFHNGRSNYYITRHIVSGMGHLKELGIAIESGTMLKRAIGYLDTTLENDYKSYLDKGGRVEDFYKNVSHLHYLYARSFFAEEYPIPLVVKKITDKSLAHYNKDWLSKTVYEKGLLAVVNHRVGTKEIAKIILTGVKESAVQSEINGMYWKENQSGWYWYQAPIETQSLLIEAFDEILNDQKTVEELKIWLIQQKRTGDWGTTRATADASYALLMTGTNFLDLDDTVSFKMATETAQQKVNTAPREAGTGTMKVIWNTKEVSKDIAQVTIQNKGSTAGYGGLFWQYFEDLDKIESSEKQILNLSKKLYLVNDNDATAALTEITEETSLQLGQTVRVQLIIKANSNMEFVHLKDMRASGLEPIDVISKHKYQDNLMYYQTTRDVATHFFFDTIKQGTYVIEYDLKVNNKGSFSNGISTLQSMYAPEFSGNTAGMRVTIE